MDGLEPSKQVGDINCLLTSQFCLFGGNIQSGLSQLNACSQPFYF